MTALCIWAAFLIGGPIVSRINENNFYTVCSTGIVESIDMESQLLTLSSVDGAAKEDGNCVAGKAVFSCKNLSSTSSASLNEIHPGEKIRIEHLPLHGSSSTHGELQAGVIEVLRD